EWAGRTFAEMPTFRRSTGVCPDCRLVGQKLALSVRAWRCPGCGSAHDRDVAAAQVTCSARYREWTREPAVRCRESEALPFVAGIGHLSGLVTAGHLRMSLRLVPWENRSYEQKQ